MAGTRLAGSLLSSIGTLSVIFVSFLLLLLQTHLQAQTENALPHISRIAFGSCAQEEKNQPVLTLAGDVKPDFFIFLGDNIYGDTYNLAELQQKYALLGAKPEFKYLKQNTRILATWDDHDYGWNDTGRHYPLKKESKEIFLDFFDEPADSPRRKHPGIYTSYLFEEKGKIIQILMLDTRTFRDNLRPYGNELVNDPSFFYTLDYYPHQTGDSTLLGKEQWKWLEEELTKKADIRIIGSSTQFGISFNGYEAWANFPHEQQRMADVLRKTNAEGVLFISGDVHYAEISRIQFDGLYPIYDVTSSGITSTWHFATPNKNRIEGPVMDNHFGLITIYWDRPSPEIRMECIDVFGNSRFDYSISLDSLRFPRQTR